MLVKVKNLKPGVFILDLLSEIESVEKSDAPPDTWWGDLYSIKVAKMDKPFESYGEMSFECSWL